jgi:hypothetical protein
MKCRRCSVGVCLTALALFPLAGCYERVVGASGPGADQVDISKPNLPKEPAKGSKAPKTVELKPLRPRI